MIIQNIPSNQIVKTAAVRNKDYEVEFVNTDCNSDSYTLKAFLRHYSQNGEENYKIRLMLTSGVLAYPALEMSWKYASDEHELASRVYHRICDEVDDVKVHFDKSMMPVATLAAQIKEAAKPISLSHQEHIDSVPLKEATRLSGVSDWRQSIYSGRYPNHSKEEQQHFWGDQSEQAMKTRRYSTREKY